MTKKVDSIKDTFGNIKNCNCKELATRLCKENATDERNCKMYGGWFPWV
jgi:hypothetical protein